MNIFIKTALTALLTAAMTVSAVPAQVNTDISLMSVSDNVNAYGRYLFNTEYTLEDKIVLALEKGKTNGTVKSLTTIKNYTSKDENYTAAIYTVDADGNRTKLNTQDGKLEVASDNEGIAEVSGELSDIPSSAVKLVTVITTESDDKMYEAEEILITNGVVEVPVKSPTDSNETTNGAHDPTIFKDPVSGKYYAYSTHNMIFESPDLINWTNKTYSDKMPKKTVDFIAENYKNTTVNGTYWAPDILYVPEDTNHPYWFYLSVSCGLGGRNSAIGLVKSDSPTLWEGENIEDCGVVIATKESSEYITNAIDANLYTDVDGKRYFIWGSFWGGIQIAPLAEDGRIVGIDYTSADTIFSGSQTAGHTVFAAPNGVLGPEGPFMITNEDEGYRYMFVSYGWLGSNYNTRVARSPITKTIAEAIEDGTVSSMFTDQNGNKVGQAYSTSRANAWGYKMIGSYQFTDTEDTYQTKKINDNWKLTSGNGQTFYANAHNSAFKDTDGEWYFVHHTKINIDWYGILCVRKMMWVNGWPVVTPTAYAGEKLQDIPVEMISGTYNLSSVGKTILPNGVTEINSSRDADLPVSSAHITLLADGTLAGGIGTWSYVDKKVTINFTADGDETLSQFYKKGDIYTMYGILGYDKYEKEYVLSLTGTDQNNTAHFAKKAIMSDTVESERALIKTTPVTVEKSKCGNPILGFDGDGNLMYGGDPAATVVGDTVYLYVGHDTAVTEAYNIPEWACYSSKDLKDWKYEGVVLKASDISWANDKNSAWASQMAEYNGKYYLYYCTWDKTDNGRQSIGVAVSDSPTGTFKDIGKPLVKGSVTVPETSTWNDIDPTVWIERDDNGEEHRYLAWGNGKYYLCELNEDMISVKDKNSDGVIDMDDIKEQRFADMGTNVFTEAPWLYRRKNADGKYYGQYYTFFAQNWREEMAYAVTDDISSNRWTYKGQLMPPTATSNTNHPSVIDFNGRTYFIYHNGMLEKGSGFRRSICIAELKFDENGNVYQIPETSTGINGKMVTLKSNDGKYIAHEEFVNSSFDNDYPIVKNVLVSNVENGYNTAWELTDGLYDSENENYVSIQAVNKPGLYIKEAGKEITLTQNADGEQKKAMTFKTVKGIDGTDGSVSFESITEDGKFLMAYNGRLATSYGSDLSACSFKIGEVTALPEPTLAELPKKDRRPENANISGQYIKDGTVNFAITGSRKYDTVNTYIAEYNDEKELVGITAKDVVIEGNLQEVSIPYTKKNEENTLKIFAWYDLMPESAGAEVTAENKDIFFGLTSHFAFDDSLTDSVRGMTAALTGNRANNNSFAVEPTYAEGYNGGKSVSFTGENSYGLKLGKVITNSKYTVSFKMKANAFTACTPALFIGDNSRWVSAPIGWKNDGTMMVWSNTGTSYVDFVTNTKVSTGKWYDITVTANKGTIKMYVDGKLAGTGSVAQIADVNTDTFLAVNYWDTPFNGCIDDLYIYDGRVLTDSEVSELYNTTK